MKNVQLMLERSAPTPDGVFGRLSAAAFPGNSGLALVTVEDDWKDNTPGESCIPPGPGHGVITYTLRRSWYHAGGYEAFEVVSVPGRSRILVHIANTEENVKGCIGVGLRMGKLLVPKDEDTGATNVEKRAVVASAEAYRRFMEYLRDVDTATLRVAWAR